VIDIWFLLYSATKVVISDITLQVKVREFCGIFAECEFVGGKLLIINNLHKQGLSLLR